MFQAVTQTAVSNLDLPKIVLAVGALGTAAYGLVDVSKSLWGGISNRGLCDIKRVVSKVIPVPSQGADTTSALALPSVLATLRANWLNGMALPDQKAVAKALIKLNLTESSSEAMAAATGIPAVLWTIIWIAVAFGILMLALRFYVAARDRAFDAKKNLPFEQKVEVSR